MTRPPPAALIGEGHRLCQAGRPAEALHCYDQALTLIPDAAEPHAFRGGALMLLGRPEEAVAAYDTALARRPFYPEAWNHRGNALAALGEPAEALASYDRALCLHPDYADVHTNRAVVLRRLGRSEEALAAAECALALDPADTRALTCRGNALQELGRTEAAVASFDRALAIAPGCAEARCNRAMSLLLAGDFSQGWRDYEARWDTPAFAPMKPPFRQRLWQGAEPLAGRTILLRAEQGIGDTLQFCRYVPRVAALGAEVVLGVPPVLTSLLAGLPWPVRLVDSRHNLPPFDLHCPLLTLPLAFGTTLATIPAKVPYLAPPAEHLRLWEERVGRSSSGPHIGLAWSGNRSHPRDRDRSMPLELLAPLAALGLKLFCLQRDLRPEDIPAYAMAGAIAYYGPALRDFADTAALIAQLDLVITVDTAVAHLAGAMGKPVWVLLPHPPDWRWMLNRDDSPWYPTMRLFRQPAPGDWGSVIRRLCGEIEVLCASNRPEAWDHARVIRF